MHAFIAGFGKLIFMKNNVSLVFLSNDFLPIFLIVYFFSPKLQGHGTLSCLLKINLLNCHGVI